MHRPRSDPEDGLKRDDSSVDDDLADLGEHDGDAGADPRLHLAEAPIGSLRIADDHAGFKEFGHRRTESQFSEDLDISGLVGSRIYHDIINPIGAIGNGVQLLGLAGQADEPVLSLIEQSVETAMARLRFLRLALGPAGESQDQPATEIGALLSDISRHGRVKMLWQAEGLIPARVVRLVLICVMCLETALPTGGTITIRPAAEGWHLTAEAPRLRDLPEMWRLFEGAPISAKIEPAMVQFAFAPMRAKELGASLSLTVKEFSLDIAVSCPPQSETGFAA